MSLKPLQGRVFITIIITYTFNVDAWNIGWRLPLMGWDHVQRAFHCDFCHDTDGCEL